MESKPKAEPKVKKLNKAIHKLFRTKARTNGTGVIDE